MEVVKVTTNRKKLRPFVVKTNVDMVRECFILRFNFSIKTTCNDPPAPIGGGGWLFFIAEVRIVLECSLGDYLACLIRSDRAE